LIINFWREFTFISIIDEDSGVKFGVQLRFAKACHKITPKSERGTGLGELPKIWGFPCIISATAAASDFNFFQLRLIIALNDSLQL